MVGIADDRSRISFCTQPNMYARGILFGKMKYELGDHSFVKCPENGLMADIEFKTKGYFGGTYNAIGGSIKNEKTGEILFELSGMWSGEMTLKDVRVRRYTMHPYCITLLTLRRLVIKKFSLMRHMQNTRPQRYDQLKNKMSGSPRSCGSRP